jgi:hypothetical protein
MNNTDSVLLLVDSLSVTKHNTNKGKCHEENYQSRRRDYFSINQEE